MPNRYYYNCAVSDQGVGLPSAIASIKSIFAPVVELLSKSSVLFKASLTITTTSMLLCGSSIFPLHPHPLMLFLFLSKDFQESTVRHYSILIEQEEEHPPSVEIVPFTHNKITAPSQTTTTVKPGGILLSGTQVSFIFHSTVHGMLEKACLESIQMLCTFCPSSRQTIVFRQHQSFESQETSFRLAPSPLIVELSEENSAEQSTTCFLSMLRHSLLTKQEKSDAHYPAVGVGRAGKEYPSMTKPTVPQSSQTVSSNLSGWACYCGMRIGMQTGAVPQNTIASVISIPVYIFRDFILDQALTDANMAIFEKFEWNEYGLVCTGAVQTTSTPTTGTTTHTMRGGGVITLRYMQPEETLCITSPFSCIVFHLTSTPIDNHTSASIASPAADPSSQQCADLTNDAFIRKKKVQKLSQRQASALLKASLHQALGQIKKEYPLLFANRRERSIFRGIPAVATAVARIAQRSKTASIVAAMGSNDMDGDLGMSWMRESIEEQLYGIVQSVSAAAGKGSVP